MKDEISVCLADIGTLGISTRRIQIFCCEGRISGAVRIGYAWAIPDDEPKPRDVRIADTLTAIDEEIEVLEIKRDKMIQIREGAMDDLLTGRVCLPLTEV